MTHELMLPVLHPLVAGAGIAQPVPGILISQILWGSDGQIIPNGGLEDLPPT